MTPHVTRTVKVSATLGMLFVLAFFLGCATLLKDKVQNSGYEEVVNRFDFLRQTGGVPGFSTQDHGRVWFILPIETDKDKGADDSYPKIAFLHASKESENGVEYRYRFMKDNSDSTWRIAQAWRRFNGEVKQVYDEQPTVEERERELWVPGRQVQP